MPIFLILYEAEIITPSECPKPMNSKIHQSMAMTNDHTQYIILQPQCKTKVYNIQYHKGNLTNHSIRMPF